MGTVYMGFDWDYSDEQIPGWKGYKIHSEMPQPGMLPIGELYPGIDTECRVGGYVVYSGFGEKRPVEYLCFTRYPDGSGRLTWWILPPL